MNKFFKIILILFLLFLVGFGAFCYQLHIEKKDGETKEKIINVIKNNKVNPKINNKNELEAISNKIKENGNYSISTIYGKGSVWVFNADGEYMETLYVTANKSSLDVKSSSENKYLTQQFIILKKGYFLIPSSQITLNIKKI